MSISQAAGAAFPGASQGTTIERGAPGRGLAGRKGPRKSPARRDGVDVLAEPRGLRIAAPVLVPLQEIQQGIVWGRACWRLSDVMLSRLYAGPLGELGDLLFAVDAAWVQQCPCLCAWPQTCRGSSEAAGEAERAHFSRCYASKSHLESTHSPQLFGVLQRCAA